MVFAKNTMFFALFSKTWGGNGDKWRMTGEKRKFGEANGPAKRKKYSDFTASDTAER